MLKRIYLAIAGCASNPPDERLTKYGAEETIIIAGDIQKTGHAPAVIFTDDNLSARQSAYVLGGVLGVFNIVHDKRLTSRYPYDPFSGKPDPLREHFRTPQLAAKFLSKAYRLKPKDETIVFMTDHCWGLTFGGSWPRSSLQCFDLPSQSLNFVAYHGPGI